MIRYRDPYKMPQPEQWFSEHPIAFAATLGAIVLLLCAITIWLA